MGCYIVSGGSRGLGLSIVRHLLSKGLQVATFARSKTEEIRELEKSRGKAILFREMDINDRAVLKDFVDECYESYQGIEGLVNNAAVGQDHLLAHLGEQYLDTIVSINLTSAIALTRYVTRKMLLQSNGGRVVSISSICAKEAYPGLTVYSATKGAIESFSRTLARELGGRKIFINCIAPGFFLSEMSALLSDEQVGRIRKRTPSGRLSEVGDVLAVLDLLLSDCNLNGEIITVDGGASL